MKINIQLDIDSEDKKQFLESFYKFFDNNYIVLTLDKIEVDNKKIKCRIFGDNDWQFK